MIRPLRRRHHRMWTGIAIVLPLGLLGAFAGRQLPPLSSDALVTWSDERTQRLDLAPGLAIELSEVPGVPPRMAARLWSALERPTLLLYWSPVAPDDDALPDQARLLASLSTEHARAFLKPPDDGFLLLTSLLDGALLGSTMMPPVGG